MMPSGGEVALAGRRRASGGEGKKGHDNYKA